MCIYFGDLVAVDFSPLYQPLGLLQLDMDAQTALGSQFSITSTKAAGEVAESQEVKMIGSENFLSASALILTTPQGRE